MRNKKGWIVNIVASFLVCVVSFSICYLILINMKELKLQEDLYPPLCESHNLTYMSKDCGFGCLEHQCYSEENRYEIIEEEKGEFKLIKKW